MINFKSIGKTLKFAAERPDVSNFTQASFEFVKAYNMLLRSIRTLNDRAAPKESGEKVKSINTLLSELSRAHVTGLKNPKRLAASVRNVLSSIERRDPRYTPLSVIHGILIRLGKYKILDKHGIDEINRAVNKGHTRQGTLSFTHQVKGTNFKGKVILKYDSLVPPIAQKGLFRYTNRLYSKIIKEEQDRIAKQLMAINWTQVKGSPSAGDNINDTVTKRVLSAAQKANLAKFRAVSGAEFKKAEALGAGILPGGRTSKGNLRIASKQAIAAAKSRTIKVKPKPGKNSNKKHQWVDKITKKYISVLPRTEAHKRSLETSGRGAESSNFSALSMIKGINDKLPQKIQEHMGKPQLVYRTGKFARSVQVSHITEQGPSSVLHYKYEMTPYGVFEDGHGIAPWANGQRDPRKLIEGALRELAAQYFTGSFTTERIFTY